VFGVTEIENLKSKRKKQVLALVTATLKIKFRKQEPVIKKKSFNKDKVSILKFKL